MPRWRKAAILGLVVGVLGGILALTPLGAAIEEDVGLNWLFKIRGPVAAPAEVVVVGIDKRSADRLGLPPMPRDWPRALHGRLIDELTRRGAAVIAFDLAFDRPREPEGDAALAAAMRRSGRVVLFQFTSRETRSGETASQQPIVSLERLISPIAPLADAAVALAPFPLPKVPAKVHQAWVFRSGTGVPTLPTVALQLHAVRSLDGFVELLRRAGLEADFDAANKRHQTNSAGEMARLMRALRAEFKQNPAVVDVLLAALGDGPGAHDKAAMAALLETYGGEDSFYLNYYGPPGAVRTIPYSTVLEGAGAEMPENGLGVAGKVVFVGVSERAQVEQSDGFYTVFTSERGIDVSGVEIAATAFANLLSGGALRPLVSGASAAIVLAFGILIGLLAYGLRVVPAAGAVLGLGAVYFGLAEYLFAVHRAWPPLFIPELVQLPLGLLLGLFLQYRDTRRERERLGQAIRFQLPDDVADEVATNPDPTAITKATHATCLRTDVENFMTVTEGMDKSALRLLMNQYFDVIGGVVNRHDGIIAVMGADSTMNLWEAPQDDKGARLRACLAALDIRPAVARFNDRRGRQPLRTRVGLDVGEVERAYVGGGGHYTYDVTGRAPSLATRIEALNKKLDTGVLASAAVVGDLDDLLLRPVGRFLLEGESRPLTIFEIICHKDDAQASDRERCARFQTALGAFQARRWAEAITRFDSIFSEMQDGPSIYYKKQCKLYQTGGPPPEHPVIREGKE